MTWESIIFSYTEIIRSQQQMKRPFFLDSLRLSRKSACSTFRNSAAFTRSMRATCYSNLLLPRRRGQVCLFASVFPHQQREFSNSFLITVNSATSHKGSIVTKGKEAVPPTATKRKKVATEKQMEPATKMAPFASSSSKSGARNDATDADHAKRKFSSTTSENNSTRAEQEHGLPVAFSLSIPIILFQLVLMKTILRQSVRESRRWIYPRTFFK